MPKLLTTFRIAYIMRIYNHSYKRLYYGNTDGKNQADPYTLPSVDILPETPNIF